MGYVIEVLNSMWNILVQFVPTGIDPTMFWLAFILVSAFTYLLLNLVHLFKNNNGIRLLVSIIIGYFAAGSAFATIFLSVFFPNLTVGLFVMLGILMVFAMVSPEKSYTGFAFAAFIILLVVIVGTWQGVSGKLGIGGSGGGGSSSLVPGMSPDDWAAIILIIAVLSIFVISVRKPKNQPKKMWWDIFKDAFFKEIK